MYPTPCSANDLESAKIGPAGLSTKPPQAFSYSLGNAVRPLRVAACNNTRADNRRPDSLPAAAQGVIELDRADDFGIVDLLERQLSREQITVRIERIELRIHAAFIATVSQSFADLQGGYQFLLLDPALARSLMRDQCVRNLLEGRADRLFIGD